MSSNMFEVMFTPIASEDIEQIFSYISEQLFAEKAATELLDKIEASIMRLTEFPFSGSLAIDEILKRKGYRKLIIDNYIVFYLVDEKKVVIIMRVLYGAQDYSRIL